MLNIHDNKIRTHYFISQTKYLVKIVIGLYFQFRDICLQVAVYTNSPSSVSKDYFRNLKYLKLPLAGKNS